MIEGFDKPLEGCVQSEMAELRGLLEELLGGREAEVRLLEQPMLRSHAHVSGVYRLRFAINGQFRSMIVKFGDPQNMRRSELAAKRWLPAVGLGDHVPALLGSVTERNGAHAWHVYEDLGDNRLDSRMPDQERVRAAIAVIVQLHTRFAGHPLLGEVRRHGTDLGVHHYEVNCCDAILALEACQPAEQHRALHERLLNRLRKLRDELPSRTRAFEEWGGPDTLLHGNLSPRNVLVIPRAAGLHASLIDLDHSGAGPAGHDLPYFLRRFATCHRPWILDFYAQELARVGWPVRPKRELNFLFDTAMSVRLANCVIWPAIAIAQDHALWGWDELAMVDQWFENLEPLLPLEAVDRPSIRRGARSTGQPVCPEILEESIQEHLAVRAWKKLPTYSSEPDGVETLRSETGRDGAVYRLYGAGPEGAAVIAKRSPAEKWRLERLIYEDVIPAIWQRPAVHYYGSLADPDDVYGWLFLEDAEGLAYSPLDESHRVLAGQWLGEMHLASLPAEVQSRLPSRDPAFYLQSLRDTRHILLDHVSHNPALSNDFAALLNRIVKFLDLLESQWDQLEKMCEAMPRTLVHGDFSITNLRVREGACGPALLVFDWESAGWGVPAVDFTQFIHGAARPDLNVYYSILKRAHPHLKLEDIQAVAARGNLFRLIDEARWPLPVLESASRDLLMRSRSTLETFEPLLVEALHEVQMVRR